MEGYRQLMNSLKNDTMLRQMTPEEDKKLRKVLIRAYQDLEACCEKHGLTVMMTGGSELGTVRHQGFIPWDDDLDVAMPRRDFEKLKTVFEEELGDHYTLSSPNYRNNAKNRFGMMLINNTVQTDIYTVGKKETSRIKIDIFSIDGIPENRVHRLVKGGWCTLLMMIAGYESTYENDNEYLRTYMKKSAQGEREYRRRMRIGKLFSFFDSQKWFNIADKAFQYHKESGLMGIPAGRKHYFGEIMEKKDYIPVSKGSFEGIEVNLPANPDKHLTCLYGNDYMKLPPVEKRERHSVIDISFGEETGSV